MSCAEPCEWEVFRGATGTVAPTIYVINSHEHPFELKRVARGRNATIVSVPIDNWNDALTPWTAPGLYRGEPDFGGRASTTLAKMLEHTIPAIERAEGLAPRRRAICGYSLGGLFSLYAFTHADAFDACACLSGSVWFEGWVDHLSSLELDLTGRFAYLLVGTKERRAARPILRTVQDNMELCAHILTDAGCDVRYVTVPGNHMYRVMERFDAGLGSLDTFLLDYSRED